MKIIAETSATAVLLDAQIQDVSWEPDVNSKTI